MIFREAPFNSVIGLVDAAETLLNPQRRQDALFRAQLAAADFIVLNKLDLVPAASIPGLVADLRGAGMRGQVLHAEWGRIPMELLFGAGLHAATDAFARQPGSGADRFKTSNWTSERPLALPLFQKMIEQLAPSLARAKGILALADQPGRTVLFQLAGQRATLANGAFPLPEAGQPLVRLVLIFEVGRLNPDAVRGQLDRCVT